MYIIIIMILILILLNQNTNNKIKKIQLYRSNNRLNKRLHNLNKSLAYLNQRQLSFFKCLCYVFIKFV